MAERTRCILCRRPQKARLCSVADHDLIEGCLGGDNLAWACLIHRYEALIYTISARTGLREPDASDVFQNVCITMLEHLAELKDASRLGGWIATTTRRESLRVRRRTGAQVAIGDAAGHVSVDELASDRETGGDLSEHLVATEEQFLVRQAMERLPGPCRRLLGLLYDAESPSSYADVSRRLGMPVGSIGPTRARCLERLQTMLREIGF